MVSEGEECPWRVDITEDPIERITEKGIKSKEHDFELDILIYATGFDVVIGFLMPSNSKAWTERN